MQTTSQAAVSIIVPAYNEAERLPLCINNILSQTYESIELIIVDDGSTDSTKDVVSDLAKTNARIRPLLLSHRGELRAKLAGIEAATGKYIGFVDADDEVEKTMYEELVDLSERHQADVVHCGYQQILPNKKCELYWGTNKIVQQDRAAAMKQLLSFKHIEMWSTNTKLFKKGLFTREVIERLNSLQTTLDEDMLMNFFFLKMANRIISYDKCLYHYRIRRDSTSYKVTTQERIFERLYARELIALESESEYKNDAIRFFLYTGMRTYNKLHLKLGINNTYCIRIREMLSKHREWFEVLDEVNRKKAELMVDEPLVYAKIQLYLQKEK